VVVVVVVVVGGKMRKAPGPLSERARGRVLTVHLPLTGCRNGSPNNECSGCMACPHVTIGGGHTASTRGGGGGEGPESERMISFPRGRLDWMDKMNLSPLWRGRAALAKLDSIPQSAGLSLTLGRREVPNCLAVPPPSAWLASRARDERACCASIWHLVSKKVIGLSFPKWISLERTAAEKPESQKESYSTASCLFSCLSHSQVGTPPEIVRR
jgi:hypothetical protein